MVISDAMADSLLDFAAGDFVKGVSLMGIDNIGTSTSILEEMRQRHRARSDFEERTPLDPNLELALQLLSLSSQ